MLTNSQIAETLRRVAAVFEVKDNDFFRTRAYQNAANSIENLTISAHDLYVQKKLTEIPGVGEALASHLAEWFRTGKVRHFDHELKRVPAGMFALLAIRGIGPKTAYKIAKKYGLKDEKTALKEVKQLIAEGKLKELPGFGAKLEKKIQTSIELKFKKKTTGRMLLSEALPIATDFLTYIRSVDHVKAAEPLGSLRRRVATIGDIDLGISTDKPKEALSKVLKYPQISRVISQGPSVARVKLKSGHEIDIKLSSPSEWGSLLHHFTGSKLHNIALRTYAISKGFSLSEHGIKDTKTKKVFKAQSEEAFYKYLGLPYIPVELREGEEEIEKAKQHRIPKLIEETDIKGDLHIHSDFDFEVSHDLGRSSLKEYLDEARRRKYGYIGLSDHNPKLHGLTNSEKKKILEARKNYLLTQYHEYEKSVKMGVPKLLIGVEVDIRSDGDLALADDLIDLTDYAIVSVHGNFELSKEENTKRIISALSHPKAVILGHPTARKLNQRDGIQADWEKVMKFCHEKGKILEVNGTPDRLDLPDDLIKMAVNLGVKLVIDTDSHDVTQMDFMKYGLSNARRGWCTAKDVVNTFSFSDLKKVLRLA